MAQKTLDVKYQKHNLRDHIYELPDTYVGSVEPTPMDTYIFNDETKKMTKTPITYVPGLYKIFDEVLVNSIDHTMRLKAEAAKGTKGAADIKQVKNIKVDVNKETGYVEVWNDGDGIDIAEHPVHKVYIPEMIFGELLTSTNYDKEEEKLWGGKNGYGAKLANIFSKEFIVETVDHRTKLSYAQRFFDNMKSKEKPKIKSAASKAPFTRIRFLPDYARFGMKGLTEDMFQLFRKRAYDACATTDASVNIYFNGEKLEAKDFEKYVDLYLGSKEDRPRVFEACNDRWAVVVTVSESSSFEQVSFVNGICTLRGGKHVDHIVNQVTKGLADLISQKQKKDVKQQHLKENLMVFVKALVANPAFDSQTKETLTTQVSAFGSKCELGAKFIEKVFKTTGIVEKAVSLTDFHDQKKLAKTDGKKQTRVLVPKLDDANHAGTKHSKDCTLILTEGDSAKTMAIAGLSVVGRDKYGVFPLRGKILNVKDAAVKKILENEEITNLKKILGLEQGKNYADVGSLRYGRIMVMCDQDVDGSHIKGLLFNVFQSLWSSLYKMPGFMTSMLTPIVKITNKPTGVITQFYNLTDYENWKTEVEKTKNGLRPYAIKYYKGLGTSTAAEAKEYFHDLKITTYKYTGEASDEGLDLAFNKKRADDRKKWLMRYNRDNVLDYKDPSVPYEQFVHKDLIHFSNRDLERSINHMCDGLKESMRKIVFGCFKRKLFTNEIRVAQLAAYISEHSAYHHGEASLQQAIITMAQNFVGSNNVNLLSPNGQFGTRIQGGSDAASPRYIHTVLTPLARKLFREEDAAILKYMDDDGMQIEPDYYIPVLPSVLMNGALGIGTGFSTNVPCFNPNDVAAICLKLIDNLDKESPNMTTREDLVTASRIVDIATLPEIHPWYLGFKGTITAHKEGSYQSTGVWKWLDDLTVEITELPVGTWTEDYKDFLMGILANGSTLLRDVENQYSDKTARFILHMYPGVRAKIEGKFATEFKLTTTKNMSLGNIHLYNDKGAIHKFKDVLEIVRMWTKVRLEKYYERKQHMLKKLAGKLQMLNAKCRFIQDIIDGKVLVMNKKSKDVDEQLTKLGYPKLSDAEESDSPQASVTGDEAGPSTSAITAVAQDYTYLTKMPIYQLTFEKKQALEKQATATDAELQAMKAKTIQAMWREEINDFLQSWEEFKTNMEASYEGTGTDAPIKKRRVTVKAATAEPKKPKTPKGVPDKKKVVIKK